MTVVSSGLDTFFQNAGTSPKLVFDVSGALVWSPHNMFLNSAAPATQSVTTVVGQNYTVTVIGSGSMIGSAGASGVATAGSPLTYTATTTTSTFTLAGSLTRIQMNRGAVATAYLATTGAIRNGLAVDYHPSTHAALGLLVEPAATNLLLNNATLSTQSATVTAAAHTLSFLGTGTVTLSGVSTAGPLVGTGASNRVSLTFTPTAGSLTLTVTGTVSNAQLEVGSVPTSIIPTFGATATRAADNPTFLLSTIPALAAEYSLYARFSTPSPASTRCAVALTDGTTNEFVAMKTSSSTLNWAITDGGVSQVNQFQGTLVADVSSAGACRVKLNDWAGSTNGSAILADPAVTLPTVTEVRFGGSGSSAAALAVYHIQKLVIVTDRGWDNATLVTKSAA